MDSVDIQRTEGLEFYTNHQPMKLSHQLLRFDNSNFFSELRVVKETWRVNVYLNLKVSQNTGIYARTIAITLHFKRK
jgi:hypothetical protein